MQRLILTLLLLQGWLFACLSCSGGAIYVTTHLTFSMKHEHLQNIRVHWYLDPVFSQVVLGDFDANRNRRFDANETADVYDNLLPMDVYNFFIDFKLNGTPLILKELRNFDVRFEKGIVSYHFDIPLDSPLETPFRFDGGFKDLEARDGSIFYRFDDPPITFNDDNTLKLDVVAKEQTDRDGWITQRIEANVAPALHAPSEATTKQTVPAPPNVLTRFLRTMTDTVHMYLVALQEKPSAGAIAMILLISLLYGMLHAAGPGHGKMLVASYFVAHDKSYTKAVSLGLMIAAVHVFSALVLTMAIYYLMDTVFSKTMEEAGRYITIGSGGVILGIACYLFWQKRRFYRKPTVPTSFRAAPGTHVPSPLRHSAPHIQSCGCHSCKTTQGSTDLMVVLLAGIVPCPGTVIIFMFALSMGLYLIGFVSAIVMSLGMGLTVALTAIISTKAKRSARRMGSRAVKTVEYGSLVVMAVLGVFLLFA